MSILDKPKNGALRAFFWALVTGIIIFLPFVIYDKGYFIYYGDFNVQQIPFYKLAHEAVRSGNIFWNWHTDLGVNFIGSYSFYLLFSPFFWLTLPFPAAFVPHLMAPLLVLKTACAALTAFLYLRRFVKAESYAVLASLLYAFSGWMAFNIFFNHFHEVAVFFPLLLLGVEKLVTEDKRGLFAVAVAVNAMVNYWFFVGEAVFVILYVLVRWYSDRSWGMNLKRLLLVALEAVVGFAMAAVVVLPSVFALLGNPRTGTDEFLSGWRIWLYYHEQRQPAIIHSLFFPPELPARPNFLPDHGAKWASLSGWLPLFSMTGVLAYFFGRRRDWLKNILAWCLLFALVPVFNSMFILFNDSYYARWFYMPVLLMALATARALEDAGPENGADADHSFYRAVKWTAVVLVVFIVMCGLTPYRDPDGLLVIGLADDPTNMWIFSAIAMVCLALTSALVLRCRGSKRFPALALAGVMVVSAGFSLFYLANGKRNREQSQWLIDHGIHGREKIDLPADGQFWRVDVHDSTDNIAMYWGLPTIQAFHSIVPPSIMEFYPTVGVTRDVGSRPEAEYFALRPLLSVRWLFIEGSKREQEPMPGYTYYATQNNFNIYENDNYLPLGFAYDRYVTPRQMEDVATANRSNLMLRAVVIDEEAEERLSDLLEPLESDGYLDFDEFTMAVDAKRRQLNTVDSFVKDNTSFTVTTSFEQNQLLFFSVPYDRGWSAQVVVDGGGGPLRIEKANIGFMAVQAPAGSATIRFTYRTPGLTLGLVITGGSLLFLAGYLLLCRGRRRVEPPMPDVAGAISQGKPVSLTAEQYRKTYGDTKTRQANIQAALNQAAATHIEEELSEEEQTLRFRPPQEPEAPPPAEDASPAKDTTFAFGEDVKPPPFDEKTLLAKEEAPASKPTPPPKPKEPERILDIDLFDDFALRGEGLGETFASDYDLDAPAEKDLLFSELEDQPAEEEPESLLDDYWKSLLEGEETPSHEEDDDFPRLGDRDDFGLNLTEDGNTTDTKSPWDED